MAEKYPYTPLPSVTEDSGPVVDVEKLYSVRWFIFWAIVVVASGSLNSVAGKIVTVPMDVFFISIFNAVVYVVVYFIILGTRVALNWTGKDQLRYIWSFKEGGVCERFPPIKYFIIMGLMDGVGTLMGFLGRSQLPGDLTVILPQTSLFFLVMMSMIILSARYSFWQLWTILLLLSGVFIVLLPRFAGNLHGSILYVSIMALSTLPSAISSVLKEKLFQDWQGLDTFIINSHSSLFQLILQPAIIPLLIIVKSDILGGLTFGEFIKRGFICFSGVVPTNPPGNPYCTSMPWPYLIYISNNILFNISILFLVRNTTALMSSMVMNAILPISVMLFFFNWPLLKGVPFSYWTIIGLSVIVIGVIAHKVASHEKKNHDLDCCDVRIPCLDDVMDPPGYTQPINV